MCWKCPILKNSILQSLLKVPVRLWENSAKWNDNYTMIQMSWGRNWNELKEFFCYSEDIRYAICTTNVIESLNFSLRKVIRNKPSFHDDDSICNMMYLAIKNANTREKLSIVVD